MPYPAELSWNIHATYTKSSLYGFNNATGKWHGICAVDLGGGEFALATSNADAAASSENVTDSGDTTVKDEPGVLESIIINNPVAGLVATIYDSTSASGTKIGTLTIPGLLSTAPFQILYGSKFTTGLSINLSAGSDLTVLYR